MIDRRSVYGQESRIIDGRSVYGQESRMMDGRGIYSQNQGFARTTPKASGLDFAGQ